LVGEVHRILKLLSGELRTFRSGPVDVTGGISCGRSLGHFLAPLIELGARHDKDLISAPGQVIGETDAARLRPHVNTCSPVRAYLPHMAGEDTLLIGCPDASRIYDLSDHRIPKLLKDGILKAKSAKPDYVVDMDLIRNRLRMSSGYPHPEATFAVSNDLLTAIMRGCQALINNATTPEPDWPD
jgi:hypothetical protein